jgi:hypothetical protein
MQAVGKGKHLVVVEGTQLHPSRRDRGLWGVARWNEPHQVPGVRLVPVEYAITRERWLADRVPVRERLHRCGQDRRVATLFVMVGLPAAGKTTMAKDLAARHRALRLTPDAWMIPLFGGSEAGGKRDVLEGRLIWLAVAASQRPAYPTSAAGPATNGRRCGGCPVGRRDLPGVPADRPPDAARTDRAPSGSTPGQTFPMSQAEVDRWRETFEVPDAAELHDHDLPDPPGGWPGWPQWAADRWPSLADS